MKMGGQEEFDTWLYDRLRELKTDETVFGPYIKSILDSDEDHEDQVEGLDGLLQELQGNFNAEKLRDEILERWNQVQLTIAAGNTRNGNDGDDSGQGDDNAAPLQKNSSGQLKSEHNDNSKIAESRDNQLENFIRLSVLDETQPSSSSVGRGQKEDLGVDSALRAAILSQYRPDDSSSEDDEGGGVVSKPKSCPLGGLEKNDNAEKVMAEQRQIKEKARLDHTKKKERDKEDRAKQKQAVLDRKEKAKKKTQKSERKR